MSITTNRIDITPESGWVLLGSDPTYIVVRERSRRPFEIAVTQTGVSPTEDNRVAFIPFWQTDGHIFVKTTPTVGDVYVRAILPGQLFEKTIIEYLFDDDPIAESPDGESLIVLANRTSLDNSVVGQETSLLLADGFPVPGVIPTSPEILSVSAVGAIPLAPVGGGQERVISEVEATVGQAGVSILIEDRIGQMGGLVGNLTTSQPVNLDLNANLAVENVDERKGLPDFTQVDWYLEIYLPIGATPTVPTVAVTLDNGTTTTVVIAAISATFGIGRRIKITPPVGRGIRSVQSVTLSLSSGGAGNFGITVVRRRALLLVPLSGVATLFNAIALGVVRIFNRSFITLSVIANAATTGTVLARITQGPL